MPVTCWDEKNCRERFNENAGNADIPAIFMDLLIGNLTCWQFAECAGNENIGLAVSGDSA